MLKTEFGILPFPKYDEAQEDYLSLDWSGRMSIPFSVSEDSYEMVLSSFLLTTAKRK